MRLQVQALPRQLAKDKIWQFIRYGKGSHQIWQNENGQHFPVPVHQGKDMKPGTVKSILEAATGKKLSNTNIKELLN